MKLFLFLILMTSTAFGRAIECTDYDQKNVLLFKSNKLQVYKISAVHILRGDIITLKAIGSSRKIETQKEGLRTYYRGEGFELIEKGGKGILTHSEINEIQGTEFFCGLADSQSEYVFPE